MKKLLFTLLALALAILPTLAQAKLSANHNQTAVQG